jgi:hypothetical protein
MWIRIRKNPKSFLQDPELKVMDSVPVPDPKMDLNRNLVKYRYPVSKKFAM